jgi:alkylation response protein AidB-like acyl-CoA dehydrogenase
MLQVASDNELSGEEFRLRAREWIADNYPFEVRNSPKRVPFEVALPWYQALHARGWLAPGWPVEHGGQGMSSVRQLIITEELARFGAVRLNETGIVMIGPLIIHYGTDAQRAHFLPRILSGEDAWCQGYSEPNAGSDLASLKSRAERQGDEWVINGEKIWTTRGANCNWMFGLFRTSQEKRKQEGISFLLLPMDAPGISVRPILDISGDEDLCQVRFENVRVPADYLVGGVGQGWKMANAILGFERISLGSPKQSENALAQLNEVMRRVKAWDDPVSVSRYVQLRLDLEDHTALYQTFVDRLRDGGDLGADVSMLKINQSELYQRLTELTLLICEEDAGRVGALPGTDVSVGEQFLIARPTTIFGGTSEIQRNILAARVLGLPR